MTEGKGSCVDAPFRYRVLVPFMARWLPFSPANSLKSISYASLFGSYMLILLACRHVGLNLRHAVSGLLVVWASFHLYCYHNPYLTDAFGLLLICMMLFALIKESFLLFAGAALLGILARETCIFILPVWLVTRQFRRSFLLIVSALVVLVVLRHVLTPAFASNTLASVVSTYGREHLQHFIFFCHAVFCSWGLVWFLSLLGLWCLPAALFPAMALAFICLFAGASSTAFISSDIERMFIFMAPVCAIACARFFSIIMGQRRPLQVASVLGLCLAKMFVLLPNRLFVEGSIVFSPSGGRVISAIEVITGLIVIVMLRKTIWREAKEKAQLLREGLRRISEQLREVLCGDSDHKKFAKPGM